MAGILAQTHRPDPPRLADQDQRVVIHGVPWRTYAALRELLDAPGLRMTYDRGALELMTPSPMHELHKTTIARLLEVFSLERGVRMNGYGSTTFRREAGERGLEPDECYVLDAELRDAPDIALEVIVTVGGLNKLPVYVTLGVRELWFFENGTFQLYALRGDQYESIAGSELIPDLDFAMLARYATRVDQYDAVREFRDVLRGG